jgi:hypothetical protein
MIAKKRTMTCMAVFVFVFAVLLCGMPRSAYAVSFSKDKTFGNDWTVAPTGDGIGQFEYITFDGVEVADGSMLQASTYFSNVSDTVSVSYRVSGDVGSLVLVSMAVVPEPTTSTLSLLALAGLCARRRRKD